MRRLSKVVTAVLAAAMVMGVAMSVSANTLDYATPGGSVDSVRIVQRYDGESTRYTLVTNSIEPWENGLVSTRQNIEGGYIETVSNYGTKSFDARLGVLTPTESGMWVDPVSGYEYTINPTTPPVPVARSSSSAASVHYACTHDGASWINDNNATENSECTKSLVCPNCGAILSQTAVYGTAFLAFNNRVAEAVKAAPAGSEVIASTKRWNTVNADVLNAIDARDDVTVRFEYIRPNDGWTAITIPAGSDCAGLANEEGFAGFEYLIQQFGSEKIQ